ncbi:MAG: glycine-rich domain-containing protein [Candidatus Microsaccharimonas sp.]
MYQRRSVINKGFALPTVLIASVVLLTVLAVSVSATSAIRTTLKNQYYTQLAQIAGEAGVAYAKACLADNGNVPQWSDAKPLKPSTDCYGNMQLGPAVQSVVVAGGGGGGNNHAGGGGGGGVIISDATTIASSTSYPVVIGAGGAGGSGSAGVAGTNGSNSTFNSLVAIGGGGGGGRVANNNVTQSKVGGSGGGGAGTLDGSTGHAGYGAAGTSGQGTIGGNGTSDATAGNGGGGGGAGGVGGNSTGSGGGGVGVSGAGGSGILTTIKGASIYYGAGGSGGRWGAGSIGVPGLGGGGTGGGPSQAGGVGSPNTGGGGGGGGDAGANGGAGGSGTVIISYAINSGITATGGTITTNGIYRVHTFTSNGNFVVTSAGVATCPTDPRCSVTVNGNVRSSFSVGSPTLDAEGKAVTIPYSGYTEITRSSNGSVWRTYNQPSFQPAVVPDLCFGAAASSLGWSNSVRASTQDSFGPTSIAQTITPSNANLNPGPIYFRKDFSVNSAGNYNLSVLAPTSQDQADVYVNGTKIATSNGSLASGDVSLTVGCNTLIVKLTNETFSPRATRFTASIKKSDTNAVVVTTDPSWRVSAGQAVHYATPNYYADTTYWKTARDYNTPGWASNTAARGITTPSATGTGYAYFRDNRTITVSTATPISTGFACAYDCELYLDGVRVATGNSAVVTTTNLTLQPGDHKFGLRQRGVSGGTGYFYFSAFRSSDNAVLSQSDPLWTTSDVWTSTAQEFYSYDRTFIPNPNPFPVATVSQVLIVGGGGGGGSDMGGGGGGGGVISQASVPVYGSVDITVGGGGAGAPAGIGQPRGLNGGDSSFGFITAFGGGGGGSEYSNNTSVPGSGASGGGVASSAQTTGAIGVLGQGNRGGLSGGSYYPGGGGGAGGVGSNTPAHGGIGVQNNILGTNYYWGGGGGGSGYSGIGGNGGAGGGGGGAVGTTTGGSGLNQGAPGGGGGTVGQVNRPGGNGGANTGGGGGGGSHYNSNNNGGNGGSGIVVVSYPTASSFKASGGTISIVGSNTVHTFTSSGTFTIVPKATFIDALVIGGGGGGGGAGSGGGAGGYVYTQNMAISTGTFPVTVGPGGSGGVGGVQGVKGFNSTFNGIVAQGGGYGISHGNPGPAGSGGSGGGGGILTGGNAPGPGAGLQGRNGGGGMIEGSWYGSLGGGGGAGTPGWLATNSPNAGNGGNGLANGISGSVLYYAGGGGSGEINGSYVGGGGTGGAGSGSVNGGGSNGTANTGGGGGGGSYNGGYANGGQGGSGIVIIRYLTGSLTAVGGTVTTSGPYTIHTFTADDNFRITALASSPPSTATVNALVVGGGGSGGGGWQGGGGGGGGVIPADGQKVGIGAYPVVVGAGGGPGNSITTFNSGGNSSFNTLVALGGGAGAGEPSGGYTPPVHGGSGGGGSHPTQYLISWGVNGQGNAGGVGISGSPYVGGGGGGAGAVGQNASGSKGGDGGSGLASSISGSVVYYGGGGGGSFRGGTGGAGGNGGGGAAATIGVRNFGLAGTANTGGGGGAGYGDPASGPSGAGGSGIVVISYLTGTMTATGGTITFSGGYTIHTFTASGTFTVTTIP